MGYSDFINLHSHSEYSNCFGVKDSTNRIDRMILYVANELKQKGFALTEHEFIGNHVKAYSTVRTLKSKNKIPQDFKLILGNEIYLVDEQQLKQSLEEKKGVKFYHFILLAKDKIGHQQLQELSTRAYSHFFNYRHIDRRPLYYDDVEEVIDKNPGHIIASTACLGGFLASHILAGEYDKARGFIDWCLDVFGEGNFFLEMQPHKKEYDEQGNEVESEQEIVNRWIQKEGLQTIITTDAHYLKESDRELHKAYLKSDEDEETYASGGRETDSFYATTYFMDTEEIRGKLNYLPSSFIDNCFKNSVDVWESCEEYDLAQHTIIPSIPLPTEWNYNQAIARTVMSNDFPYIHQMLKSENEYDRYLIYLAFEGILERRIPEDEWYDTLKRLDIEMCELIGISRAKDAVVSSYFITMHKMINIFWNEAKCFTGCSRGSAAGWILNYLLQITQENPLKQPTEMYHWRFISAERPDYPKCVGVVVVNQ